MHEGKGGKNDGGTEPRKSLINRYGDGWNGLYGLGAGRGLSEKEEKAAEKSYVRVRSEIEHLVSSGRYRPK